MKKLEIDKSIWYLPLFLIGLSLFLFSLSFTLHLGIIGVIVFVRAIFVSINHYRYYKNFKCEIENGIYTLKFGFKYPFRIFIEENDILDIELKTSKLFKKQDEKG